MLQAQAPPGVLNAFTIDVEDYFHVTGYANVIPRSAWDGFATRVERNTEAILRLLEDRGLRGTFFVLGWVAKRYPALVKRIAQAGHEVASHGMDHTLVYDQTPAVFREETRASKAILEDLCGAPVLGYRAATYSITQRSLWALDILAEEGFTYDSSIFPIRHDRYGIAHAPRLPYTLECSDGRPLVEFPLSTLKVLGLHLPVAGGGYFRLFPYRLTALALARLNRQEGAPFIFYLHPWEIDAEQPRIAAASRLATWRHRHNLDRCQGRLQRLLGRFSFAPVREVLERHRPALFTSVRALAAAGA